MATVAGIRDNRAEAVCFAFCRIIVGHSPARRWLYNVKDMRGGVIVHAGLGCFGHMTTRTTASPRIAPAEVMLCMQVPFLPVFFFRGCVAAMACNAKFIVFAFFKELCSPFFTATVRLVADNASHPGKGKMSVF